MQSFKRFVSIAFGVLAMAFLALVCAFSSMRLAIHGREVEVPNLSGHSDEEAAAIARHLGLNLSVENRFYSPAIPPNHVLSQLPSAGSRVRRGWQVRVTESLGAAQVAIPDVTGVAERPASLMLKRLSLESGAVAHLPAPAPPGIVLAQSPPANSKGPTGPSVSLLVSGEDSTPDVPAFVMPSITGLSLAVASARLASAGLRIAVAEPPPDPAADPSATTTPATTPADPFDTAQWVTPAPASINATITSQSPLPGHRITRSDTIHVTLSH